MQMAGRLALALGLVGSLLSSSCSSKETASTPATAASVQTPLLITISSGALVPAFDADIHDYTLTSFTTLQDVTIAVDGRPAQVLGLTTTPGVAQVMPAVPITASATIPVVVDGIDGAAPTTYTIHLTPGDLPAFTTIIDNPEPGKIFLTPLSFLGTGPGPYLMTVSTAGNVLAYTQKPNEVSTDLKRNVLPDGTVRYTYISAGAAHLFDANMNFIRDYTILATSRHAAQAADEHDIHVLGDDHVIIDGYVHESVTNIPSTIAQSAGSVNVTAAVIQEIENGQVLFEWDSTEHPELYALSTESNDFTNTAVYADYAHLNSMVVDPANDNLMVSFRHLDSVLEIHRPDGAIVWRLGGPDDTFGTTADQKSSHQHFASILSDGRVMMFDNGYVEKASRVLTFGLDVANSKIASFESMPLGYFGSYMGSTQPVGTGSLLVGMGTSQVGEPDVVLYDRASGKHTFTLTLGADDYYSYRAQWEDGVGR